MGFINPGKPLNKRKAKRNDLISPKKPSKLMKLTESKGTFIPSSQQEMPSDHFTLDSLPIEILHKIFAYIGPYYNTLPLVNKRLHSILYFTGNNTSSDSWYNFTLFERIVKDYFLYDLNERIDMEVIDMKLDYYDNQIKQLKEKFPNFNRSHTFQRLVDNLNIIRQALDAFIFNHEVLTVDILNFKFISTRLLKTLNQRRYKKDNVYMPIKSKQEILLLQKLRLKFLRFKFKELGLNLRKSIEELSNDEPVPRITYENLNCIVDSVSDELEDETNPEIKIYNDENFPTEGFFWSISEQYIKLHDNYIVYNEGFETVEKQAFGRVRIPYFYFIKSIYSERHYDVLKFITQSFEFGTIDGPQVMVEMLDILEKPDNFPTAYWPRLNGIIEMIMTFNDVQNKFTETVSLFFKLYESCVKRDYSTSKSKQGKSFPNFIAKAMTMLLQYFFDHDPTTEEKRQLWITAMELKNIHITDLLREFDDTPDYDILHRFI